MTWVLFLGLAWSAAAQDVPYFIRDTKANQDLGALNRNEQELATSGVNCLTTALSPDFCPPGQALTGACYRSGRQWGGTCTAVGSSSSVSSQTFSGNNIVSNGSTFYFMPDANVNLCGECGGIFITSMTLNNTFVATFSGFSINMTTRNYCAELVAYTTNAITAIDMYLNNFTGLAYSQTDIQVGASETQYQAAYYANRAVALGHGTTSNNFKLTAGTYTHGKVDFHAISSTTVAGNAEITFNSNDGAGCSNAGDCLNRTAWLANHLAAITTRIDFCTNSTGASTAPDCLTPMHSGHINLCAAGFRNSP